MNMPTVEILYKLANGKWIRIEVSVEVKELLEQTDRQIRSQRRQDRRYRDDKEYIDGETEARMYQPQEEVADLVARLDIYRRLNAALETLPESQRRRLLLHCVNGLTCRQIAEAEGVNFKTVSESISKALKTIKNSLGE